MGEKVNAVFAFKPLSYKVTMSTQNTNKPVTISKDNFFITTTKIINKEKPEILFNFLKIIGLIKLEEDIPSWIYEYEFYNDTDIKNKIKEQELIIEDAKKDIMKCNEMLQKNMNVKKYYTQMVKN